MDRSPTAVQNGDRLNNCVAALVRTTWGSWWATNWRQASSEPQRQRGYTKRSAAIRVGEVMIFLDLELVEVNLEFRVQFSILQDVKGTDNLEWVQPCGEVSKNNIILANLPIRRQGIGAWQDDEGQGTYFETKRFWLDGKRNCFHMKIVRQWSRLTKYFTQILFLEIAKTWLDKTSVDMVINPILNFKLDLRPSESISSPNQPVKLLIYRDYNNSRIHWKLLCRKVRARALWIAKKIPLLLISLTYQTWVFPFKTLSPSFCCVTLIFKIRAWTCFWWF